MKQSFQIIFIKINDTNPNIYLLLVTIEALKFLFKWSNFTNMAQLLGTKYCIDSLLQDVKDIQETVSEVSSRVGQVCM